MLPDTPYITTYVQVSLQVKRWHLIHLDEISFFFVCVWGGCCIGGLLATAGGWGPLHASCLLVTGGSVRWTMAASHCLADLAVPRVDPSIPGRAASPTRVSGRPCPSVRAPTVKQYGWEPFTVQVLLVKIKADPRRHKLNVCLK